jgi:hypothetical protein
VDAYPSDEAYLHGPVTQSQRLTSKAHMSDPWWRDARPSRPYAGEPEGRPPGRDTRGLDPRAQASGRHSPGDEAGTRRMPAQPDLTAPVAPQPRATRSRRAPRRARRSGGRLSRIWEGSLRGALGVCVIAGSALIGTVATIVHHSQPGSILGLFVLAGTVAAALTVQPRTGRLIFPVPALSYLIAALVTGVAYDRSSDKTELAVGAAQWIASGFFVMVLATLLAIALTTVRWFMWRRDQHGRQPPEPGPPRPPGSPPGTTPPGVRPGTQPPLWPAPGTAAPPGWGQRPGPRPDQRPGPRPGTGPYNFSRGA